ncbi:MAG: peptidylprolyl isomerase [Planctomycetaceae bacterium]|nr:peptidylprolyl isomerase [Planctomycetaceae bacterium]
MTIRTMFCVIALAAAVGCDGMHMPGMTRDPSPPAAPVVQPAPAAAPVAPARPLDAPVMANVNGRPIYMRQLHDVLVQVYGMRFAQQLVINELVRQAAADKGVAITEQDVADETERAVQEAFPSVSDPQQRSRLLDEMLVKRQLPRQQWDMAMQRNAMLRKMTPLDIAITESDLRAAYDRKYTRQVVIRHIQVATLDDAQKVLTTVTSGQDFAQTAARFSTNESRSNGGLLPPFGKSSGDIPAALREVALSLRKVGEISNPIQVGAAFHIIRLEKIIEPPAAKFETVKNALTLDLRQEKIRATQQALLAEIIRRANVERKIEFVDPILKARTIEESGQ